MGSYVMWVEIIVQDFRFHFDHFDSNTRRIVQTYHPSTHVLSSPRQAVLACTE